MDQYSRFIALLKIVLPLAALLLLSTLFLLSRGNDQTVSLPYSGAEITARLRDQQITGPFFTGTTSRGDRIAFAADKLISLSPETQAQGITARLDLAQGEHIFFVADVGNVDLEVARASLSGNIKVSGAGLEISLDQMDVDLETGTLASNRQVVATGQMGQLSAGRMLLRSADDLSGSRLIFANGVTLLFYPEERTGGQ